MNKIKYIALAGLILAIWVNYVAAKRADCEASFMLHEIPNEYYAYWDLGDGCYLTNGWVMIPLSYIRLKRSGELK